MQGGIIMRRRMLLIISTLLVLAGSAGAEETSWYLPAEGWIVRVVTSGTGPYTVNLEELDTANSLIPPADIVGLNTNPHAITTAAVNPYISMSFNEASSTAFVFYTDANGLVLQQVPDIKKNAPAAPVLAAGPNPLAFGTVTVGQTLSKTVTVTNTGTANLNITTIGTPAAPFSKVGGTCAVGIPVTAGGNCSVIVRFAPVAGVTYNGSLGIGSDGGNATVGLTGTGSAAGGGGK